MHLGLKTSAKEWESVLTPIILKSIYLHLDLLHNVVLRGSYFRIEPFKYLSEYICLSEGVKTLRIDSKGNSIYLSVLVGF